MMCEIPSNAILADEFLEYFDGFSIGSNDLTQLTLGLDRDSGLEVLAADFDERDPAVKALISLAIRRLQGTGQVHWYLRSGPKRSSGLCPVVGGRRHFIYFPESGLCDCNLAETGRVGATALAGTVGFLHHGDHGVVTLSTAARKGSFGLLTLVDSS
jgi:hypothetical protein